MQQCVEKPVHVAFARKTLPAGAGTAAVARVQRQCDGVEGARQERVDLPFVFRLTEQVALTPLTYTLIWIHCLILMAGGHYTYAQVPLGFWMERLFGFTRNHYDRIGHFAQGFVPAMLAREIFIRRSPLRHSAWLPFLVVCFCLAFSALYELIEFWTALSAGGAATDFLGTQGDVWDTQWDMQMALIGAIVALLTLSKVQDRQLARAAES